jgi:hypothetical protein
MLTPNCRSYYPDNPATSFSNGEYGFLTKKGFITNGDIQQMIRRIFQIFDEEKKLIHCCGSQTLN